MSAATPRPRVAFSCDAGLQMGLGHVVRCLALARELRGRGCEVAMLAPLGGLGWPAAELARSGIMHVETPAGDAGAIVRHCRQRRVDVLVLDSYLVSPDAIAQLAAEDPVLAVVDDEAGRPLPVDVVVNQSPVAEGLFYTTRTDTARLLGPSYALLRPEFRAARRRRGAAAVKLSSPLRALVLLGGTDVGGRTPALVRALLGTGLPLDVRAVCSSQEAREGVLASRPGAGQRVEALEPVADVVGLMEDSDIAVSAAGSTCWELACLGLPTALLVVADNQRRTADWLVRHDLVLGLGENRDLSVDAAADALRGWLLDDRSLTAMASRWSALVDGCGAERVASAVLRRRAQGSAPPGR